MSTSDLEKAKRKLVSPHHQKKAEEAGAKIVKEAGNAPQWTASQTPKVTSSISSSIVASSLSKAKGGSFRIEAITSEFDSHPYAGEDVLSIEREEYEPGEMVQLVNNKALRYSKRTLRYYPELLKNIMPELNEWRRKLSAQHPRGSKEPWSMASDWLIDTNWQMKIEDDSLLKEEHIIVGPFRNVDYPDGDHGPMKYPDATLSREELPVGTTGMVVKKVNVSSDQEFYQRTGTEDFTPYYIVLVVSLFDVVKGGLYLFPVLETLRYEGGERPFFGLSIYPRDPDPNRMAGRRFA